MDSTMTPPPVLSCECGWELMARVQAASHETSGFGAWPPAEDLIRVLREWFAEYGLHIDDDNESLRGLRDAALRVGTPPERTR